MEDLGCLGLILHLLTNSLHNFYNVLALSVYMPTIIKDDQKVELAENQPIKEACEQLGVLFGCTQGYCGTCMIDIEEGEENLSALTPEEVMMERDKMHRLACQTKIVKGIVKIK